jgi:hypothetical protein
MLTVPNELALTESRTMRTATIARTDVLAKVKSLTLLPDDIHATTEIVADFYGVPVSTIKSLAAANREELAANGRRVLRGVELREFAGPFGGLANLTGSTKARSLALFTRRAILNVGQLLTDSPVAEKVRAYLIEIEEQASPLARSEAVDRVALAEARIRMLKETDGFLDAAWVRLKIAHQAAYGLGEEPEVDPLDRPLYVPDFLKSKGLKKSQIISVQSWFGRRVAALFEAETGDQRPGSRTADTAAGSVRDTVAWTERHRAYFEDTWARYYAKDYPAAPAQLQLTGGA